MGEPGFPDAASRRSGGVRAAIFSATCLGVTLSVAAHLDGPPPAHAGGFGEPTCHECHWENPLNDPAGTLTLSGVPESYTPGQSYALDITLTRPDLGRGGFQLTARFADGDGTGRQAGMLRPVSSRTTTIRGEDSDIQYAQQTNAGSEVATPNTTRWTVEWASPTGPVRRIIFHLAANAGNDDDSDLGDFIYTTELRVEN